MQNYLQKKTFRLNPMAIPYACKSENRDFDVESWKEWSDAPKISESTMMIWITLTACATKQNENIIDKVSESDQESAFINPCGILSEEDEQNEMNAMLDRAIDKNRDNDIERKTMHDDECHDKSNNEIKLKNVKAKKKINPIVPLNDKLIMECDECNANNITEEMLDQLIHKIMGKDSKIRESHHQANATQDFKEFAHHLKVKLDKKEAECDQVEED